MKDIIIVGTGKAGFLHYYSYKKFEKIGRIYFVDIDGKIKNENIKDSKVYSSIESTIKKEKLDVNNIIVDICTPKSVFLDIIMECKQLNIRDILVEKPFIVNKEFFEENDDLNIAMVHNYEYSKIVMKIKEYIVQKELKPVIIYTNFSKNRTEESFNGRGMYKKVTRNIEHDIPHQVYISQFLLDNPKDTQVLLEEEKAMERGNRILEKHGYSKIFTKKNDVYVIHESDFATNTKIREVIVICENNIVIKGEFLFYDKDLNKLKDGNVSIIQNNKVIHSEKIDFDAVKESTTLTGEALAKKQARDKELEAIIKGENIPAPGIPESFKVLLKEFQSLGLDVGVLDENGEEVELGESMDTGNENVKKYMGEDPDDFNEDLGENGYSGINEDNELESLNDDYLDDDFDGNFDDEF